jgi:uncharacterized protein YndB with AHSA1/START domain
MKRILLVLAAALVLFLGFAATRPDTFHVERSSSIAAPASAIYPHLVDFRQWAAWSPWEKLDPGMKRDFGGPEGGVGATYAWEGNSDVGKGKMTITQAEPPAKLAIRLEFLEPFASTSVATFALAPEGEGTRVTWSMDGDQNFIAKVICIFMDMDKMIGGDFEKGLASLRQVSEAAATGS